MMIRRSHGFHHEAAEDPRPKPRVAPVKAAVGLLIGLAAISVFALACGGRDGKPSLFSRSKAAGISVINRANPGERVPLAASAVKGKTTLFEFYSDRCEPCRRMQPVLEYLAPRRPDLVIRKVDIDRPGSTGIDFESPLAQQYGVEAVPAFRIYDENGKLAAAGSDAREEVARWYSQAQMIERGEQDPGMRNIMKDYEKHDGR
jgi:thiol-disulfide isomerase/thioredoxin